MTVSENLGDAYHHNLLRLAQDHKAHCLGEACEISLVFVAVAAELGGVPFTKEELDTFL